MTSEQIKQPVLRDVGGKLAAGNRLKVLTLGGLSIQENGVTIGGFVSRKVEGLFIYLLYQQREIPREVLADLLWNNSSPTRALANLRTALSDLQQRLAPYLRVSRQQVAVSTNAQIWFDVQALEAELDAADVQWDHNQSLTASGAQRLEEALDLYRGDFLSGFFLRDSEVFESWLNVERERLRKRVGEGLRHLAQFKLATRAYTDGIVHARRLTQLDPAWEEAHRLLMLLLVYADQRSAALAQFEQCRAILQDELGIEPSQETLDLYDQILAGQVSVPSNVPQPTHNLMVAPTAFIDRPREIQQIGALLDQPDCRLLTLLGAGGIGKSRLALQMGWNRLQDYRDGVYFVSLAGVNNVEAIPAAIVLALRVGLEGQADLRAQMLTYLHDKHALLILDNLEHLLDSAPLISDLLARAPRVQILATSRERLNLQGEWLLEIQGMEFPQDAAFGIGNEAQYSALELFRQVARRVYPEFSFETNCAVLGDVIRICELVEGLPLGIELAAAHLRFMSCHDVANQIENDLDFLSTTLHNVPERHRSIRMLFGQTFKLLSGAEQLALMKLSVFAGGAQREAAEVVAGATLPVLVGLIERSLVRFSGEGRYEMHQLVRRCAYEMLEASGNLLTVQEAYCNYLVTFADSAERSKQPAEETYNRFDAEYSNFSTVLEWTTAQRKFELLLRLCGALNGYWQKRGMYQEGYRWLSQSLALLDQSGVKVMPEIEIQALDAAGIFAWSRGDVGPAEYWLMRSLQLRRSCHYLERMCTVLDYISLTYMNSNRFDEAKIYIDEALDLARQHGDNAAIAQELMTLGVHATHLTDWESALHYFDQAFAMFNVQGNLEKSEVTLANCGVVYIKLGRLDEAENCYQRSLAMLQISGVNTQHASAVVYGNLGELTVKRGAYAQAHEHYRKSLGLLRDLDDKVNIAYLLEMYGGLAILEKQAAHGLNLFGAAEALREMLGAGLSPREYEDNARYIENARAQLDEAAFAKAWEAGRSWSMDEAVDRALAVSR